MLGIAPYWGSSQPYSGDGFLIGKGHVSTDVPMCPCAHVPMCPCASTDIAPLWERGMSYLLLSHTDGAPATGQVLFMYLFIYNVVMALSEDLSPLITHYTHTLTMAVL
jgi:hypothetical protein